MKKLLLLSIILISAAGQSQILNAESLRKVTDTSGFSGAASFNFALKRNVNDFITLSSDIHLQYKNNNHLALFKNDVQFQKIEGEKFENSLISHLRYNYRFHPRIAWEIFTQGQYNKINLIAFRGLLGSGPRIKLSTSENYKFYLGAAAMFEYEEVTDGVTPLQRNFRGSSYVSFSLYPTNHISIISTTYYQPLFKQFADYRISSQTSVAVGLFTNLSVKLSHTFVYDAFPAIGIPNSQYEFTTGVAYTFD